MSCLNWNGHKWEHQTDEFGDFYSCEYCDKTCDKIRCDCGNPLIDDEAIQHGRCEFCKMILYASDRQQYRKEYNDIRTR